MAQFFVQAAPSARPDEQAHATVANCSPSLCHSHEFLLEIVLGEPSFPLSWSHESSKQSMEKNKCHIGIPSLSQIKNSYLLLSISTKDISCLDNHFHLFGVVGQFNNSIATAHVTTFSRNLNIIYFLLKVRQNHLATALVVQMGECKPGVTLKESCITCRYLK